MNNSKNILNIWWGCCKDLLRTREHNATVLFSLRPWIACVIMTLPNNVLCVIHGRSHKISTPVRLYYRLCYTHVHSKQSNRATVQCLTDKLALPRKRIKVGDRINLFPPMFYSEGKTLLSRITLLRELKFHNL